MGNDQETRMGATFEAWATPEEGEWPKRDAVPVISAQAEFYRIKNWQAPPIGQRPAEVTPEMERAAELACERLGFGFVPELAAPIFRAMHAVAPVELVSPAEIALIRERDEARAFIGKLTDWNCEYGAKNERLSDDVDSLRAELMAAHDNLARQAKALGDAANTIAAPTHTESTPDPIANAIRDHDTDRRRMGPI